MELFSFTSPPSLPHLSHPPPLPPSLPPLTPFTPSPPLGAVFLSPKILCHSPSRHGQALRRHSPIDDHERPPPLASTSHGGDHHLGQVWSMERHQPSEWKRNRSCCGVKAFVCCALANDNDFLLTGNNKMNEPRLSSDTTHISHCWWKVPGMGSTVASQREGCGFDLRASRFEQTTSPGWNFSLNCIDNGWMWDKYLDG